jgi:hypothetical protein
LSFVDLDKSATDRCPALLEWIRGWCSNDTLLPLTPAEWFQEGHGITGGAKDRHGVWIPTHEPGGKLHLWAPPPAVADAMLEEVSKARHKRTDTYHIIVIPRLMSPRWRRLFHKVVDMSFIVAPGSPMWPSNMFEPVWIGIVLPFIPHRPWCFKGTPLMVEMGRSLREVCQESDTRGRDILCKLLKLPRRLASVSPDVARAVLRLPRN